MRVSSLNLKIILLILICFTLYCSEYLKGEDRGYTEMQKKVIKEDKFNIKNKKDAAVFLDKKCKYFNVANNIKSSGEFESFDCSTTALVDNDLKYIVFYLE